MSEQPLSTEFFSSPAEAQDFLRRIPSVMTQLRERLGSNEDLDFSPESLVKVDRYVLRKAHGRPVSDDRELALQVAAYFGEVLRRTLSGRWALDSADPLMPVVVLTNPPTIEYPLLRVKKLWEDGARLYDWYGFIAKGGDRLLT